MKSGVLLALLALPRTASAADELRVASKSFTESVILGEIAALTASGAGVPAQHRRALGGTRLCWDALLAGQIDVYPDYTGTLTEEILRGAAPAGADVATLRPLLRARGVGLIGPLGFDNTYAIGMRAARAAEKNIRTLSELARHPDLRFGFSNEFMNRRDGWPGLAARYGLPQTAVQGLDHDLAYRGLVDGSLDATDLYQTDAEIRRYDLRVLADDRGFFPRYEAVLVHRLDAEARFAPAFTALQHLTGTIDAATMTGMNADAKLNKMPEAAVAANFVARTTGRSPSPATAGPGAPHDEAAAAMIWRRTREHLALVAVSLLAAIAIALPLGILAARRPRLGQVVLAAVGVVQTIPSLALLVFMIPLLGIGALPATAALFLYSLLPIVRNTHAGLRGVSPSLRDSAQALGLPPLAILWQIELPLALGTILAGIKSAAVINVGTATLGALIGAGGLGQPIFTGIRLDDLPLILEGALPASLLALAVQGVFDLLERVLVPRGLRP
ncbi:MAG TPA: glycine betaine ABC transporter substrate-binding protein [Polyangia bacterium]|nr:glycine betaine ABC transporter substrate-binding protein [Polyangia bacterium]